MRRRYIYDRDLDCVRELHRGNMPDGPEPKVHYISDTLPGGVKGTESMLDRKRYDSKSRYYASIKERGLAIQEPGMVGEKPEPDRRQIHQATADAYYGRYNREPEQRAAYEERNRRR